MDGVSIRSPGGGEEFLPFSLFGGNEESPPGSRKKLFCIPFEGRKKTAHLPSQSRDEEKMQALGIMVWVLKSKRCIDDRPQITITEIRLDNSDPCLLLRTRAGPLVNCDAERECYGPA